MGPFLARFSEPVWSGHLASWADFITTTPELEFSVQTTVSRTARQLSTEVTAGLLSELTHSTDLATLPAFVPERLATTARFFLDLVLVPMLLRGLFEDKVERLEPEIGPQVARTLPFFLAACRYGGG